MNILPALLSLSVLAQPSHDTPSGADMAHIPGGEFWMGFDDAPDDEQPPHRVYLDSFWIDKTEVTVTQYNEFSRATGRTTREQPGWNKDNHPVVNVDWDDARSYCAWAGKRLPTEAEWEKAARGPDGRKRPWGNDPPDAGGVFRMNWGEGLDREVWKRDGYEYTAPVGSYPAGASPYGLLDMAGNVWEWVADWYDENYYRSAPPKNPKGPPSGSAHSVRGGSWYVYATCARSSNRRHDDPAARSTEIGFRCASSAPPRTSTAPRR
ncbi:MAG: formylglycine-generating enzyme family protein [Elusimicrobiota bacterium]